MTDQTERDRIVSRAYGKATSELRAAHRTEFNALVRKFAESEGVDWSPRPTAEDRAREKVQSILREHPDLAAEFVSHQ